MSTNDDDLDPWGTNVPVEPSTANSASAGRKPLIPETPTTVRRAPAVASTGSFIKPEDFPLKPLPVYPDSRAVLLNEYVPDMDVDYSDISVLNRDINQARARLFRVTNFLKESQRREAEAKYEFRRAHNRIMVTLNGGSEKQRLAAADIETEELWGNYIVAERVSEEATNLVRAVRSDLDALAGLSHNIRAQMQLS